MTRSLALVALLTATSALVGTSDAEALSCQRRIVARGDTAAKVLALCGEPQQQVNQTVLRSQSFQVPLGNGRFAIETLAATVEVSQWTYDFGPLRLMQELTFENGILVRLRTLDRGGVLTSLQEAPVPGAAAAAWAGRADRARRRSS